MYIYPKEFFSARGQTDQKTLKGCAHEYSNRFQHMMEHISSSIGSPNKPARKWLDKRINEQKIKFRSEMGMHQQCPEQMDAQITTAAIAASGEPTPSAAPIRRVRLLRRMRYLRRMRHQRNLRRSQDDAETRVQY